MLDRVAGIRFQVGVFTNLTQDHLDFHGSMDEYAAAKRKLFQQCEIGCVNLDDEWAEYMMRDAACPFLTFSAERNDVDLAARDIRLSAAGVRFAAVNGDQLALTKLAIPGLFSVHNALGVIAVGLALGLKLTDCADAMSSAKGVKGRVESVPTDGEYAVLIDYAHTPDALENVLKTLRPLTKGRLIVLFGCGGDRDRAKRPLMGAIAEAYADICVVTSDNPRTEDPEGIIREILAGMKKRKNSTKVICDRIEAIHWAIDKAGVGDVILLAGKGHEDYQVIGHREASHGRERNRGRIPGYEEKTMTIKLLCAFAVAFVFAAFFGKIYIPWLRRQKAGQAIKDNGPTWHMSKSGTPTMGGVMFILGTTTFLPHSRFSEHAPGKLCPYCDPALCRCIWRDRVSGRLGEDQE